MQTPGLTEDKMEKVTKGPMDGVVMIRLTERVAGITARAEEGGVLIRTQDLRRVLVAEAAEEETLTAILQMMEVEAVPAADMAVPAGEVEGAEETAI
jgi:hypothetical protein